MKDINLVQMERKLLRLVLVVLPIHLERYKKVLDDENSGIYLDVVVFDAYNLPNEALNNGEIDLNSFQHKAYLENECKAQGYDLTAIGDTSSAPLTLYSKKVDSLKALKRISW